MLGHKWFTQKVGIGDNSKLPVPEVFASYILSLRKFSIQASALYLASYPGFPLFTVESLGTRVSWISECVRGGLIHLQPQWVRPEGGTVATRIKAL